MYFILAHLLTAEYESRKSLIRVRNQYNGGFLADSGKSFEGQMEVLDDECFLAHIVCLPFKDLRHPTRDRKWAMFQGSCNIFRKEKLQRSHTTI